MRVPYLPPAIPALLLAWIVTLIVFAMLSAGPARAGQCERAIAAAAQRHGVDEALMLAISRVESGLTPWIINAEGVGQRFASKADAVARVAELQASGVSSIDIGCMQVNLHWHPDAFPSLEHAFDPHTNADYAARYLRRLRVETGSWTMAAVRYHSAAPERQEIYGCAVQAEFDRLRRVAARPCVYRPGGRQPDNRVTRPARAEPATATTAAPAPRVPGAAAVVIHRPARGGADDAADAAPPAPATGPAAGPAAQPGTRGPQIIRLSGGDGGAPVATLRGPGDRPAAPAGDSAGDPSAAAAAAEPVLSAYQPRARVMVLPGGSEPPPVSVLTGEIGAAGAGFLLN
jgi:hypothetical protein